MRGPGLRPASIACFRPNDGPARSRMLVKPRSSVLRASSAAARLMKPISAVINCSIGSDAIIECQCASISPGMSVRPPPSMTSAPSGTGSPAGSTALILLPSTTTRRPSINWPDLPSKILTLVKTTGAAGASGIAAIAPLGQSAAAPRAAAAAGQKGAAGEFLFDQRVQTRKGRTMANTGESPAFEIIGRRTDKHRWSLVTKLLPDQAR